MKNNQDIVDKIKTLLGQQLDRSITSFAEAESFIENGCDEFDFIELVMSVEDHFDISLEEQVTAGISIVALADLIYHYKKSNK